MEGGKDVKDVRKEVIQGRDERILTQLGPAECRNDLEDSRAVGILFAKLLGQETVKDLFFLLLCASACWREKKAL